jgi:hemerythrin superfamily protein
MDAITLLKEDHKTVEKLFKRFEKAGEGAHAEQSEIVARIIRELSIHAAIEEQLFYPVTRETVEDIDDVVLESLEEHHIVKWVLDELEHMDPSDERYRAKVTVLMENVRHHVEEEETDYFPKVREQLGRNALAELGDAMVEAKKTAPTHPHPKAPDTPPANVANASAGVLDRVTDTVGGIAQGGVTAAQDLIARLTGGPKPRVAPRGSAGTRTTANKVRTKADDAVERAQRTGEAVTKAATEGAKATAGQARSAATRTARTTKKTASHGAKTTAGQARSAATKTARTAKKTASA